MATEAGVFDNIAKLDSKEGINIEIGTKLFMEIEGIEFQVESVFVGMRANEYVIITPPTRFVSIKEKLFQGNGVIVKYLFEGTVFAFQTKVIEVLKQPIKVVLLEYPKLIQNHELRALKRNECFLPVKVSIDKILEDGIIRDISKKGCRCQIQVAKGGSSPYFQRKRIALYCELPGVKGKIELAGYVKNVHKQGKFLIIGVKFDILPDDVQETIAHYIFATEEFVK